MRTILFIISLCASTAFAEGKYKTVVIDEKKVEAQKPISSPSKKYEQNVTKLLKKDLKAVDVHLADEGSLKWLFVVVNYNEWKSFNRENRRELVELLLRHMKQNFPKNGLKVSVGVNADQPLAEGDWGQLSDGPSVKLVGEQP
jgi:hypothetical protein